MHLPVHGVVDVEGSSSGAAEPSESYLPGGTCSGREGGGVSSCEIRTRFKYSESGAVATYPPIQCYHTLRTQRVQKLSRVEQSRQKHDPLQAA